MGMIIGRNYKYAQCDVVGCKNKSKEYTDDDKAEKRMRNDGWYISFSDSKCYCPEHAYKV